MFIEKSNRKTEDNVSLSQYICTRHMRYDQKFKNKDSYLSSDIWKARLFPTHLLWCEWSKGKHDLIPEAESTPAVTLEFCPILAIVEPVHQQEAWWS